MCPGSSPSPIEYDSFSKVATCTYYTVILIKIIKLNFRILAHSLKGFCFCLRFYGCNLSRSKFYDLYIIFVC